MGPRIGLSVMPLETRREAIVAPAPDLPIYVAALGDAMTRLAGELADAWAPFLYPWAELATGVERLREGATRGGHPHRLPEIHPTVPAVVAESAAKAREGAAWFVAFYVTTMGFTGVTRPAPPSPVLLLRPNLTQDERARTLDAFRPMLASAPSGQS